MLRVDSINPSEMAATFARYLSVSSRLLIPHTLPHPYIRCRIRACVGEFATPNTAYAHLKFSVLVAVLMLYFNAVSVLEFATPHTGREREREREREEVGMLYAEARWIPGDDIRANIC